MQPNQSWADLMARCIEEAARENNLSVKIGFIPAMPYSAMNIVVDQDGQYLGKLSPLGDTQHLFKDSFGIDYVLDFIDINDAAIWVENHFNSKGN